MVRAVERSETVTGTRRSKAAARNAPLAEKPEAPLEQPERT